MALYSIIRQATGQGRSTAYAPKTLVADQGRCQDRTYEGVAEAPRAGARAARPPPMAGTWEVAEPTCTVQGPWPLGHW